MTRAWTGPASSAARTAWTSQRLYRELSAWKPELTTATRACVSLPGLVGPRGRSSLYAVAALGFRACSNFLLMTASTEPMVPDPALLLLPDNQMRPAMENRRLTSCPQHPLSLGSALATAVSVQGPGSWRSRRNVYVSM